MFLRYSTSRLMVVTMAFLALLLLSCGGNESNRHAAVSVSNPAMGYFVSRLLPDTVMVNVLIPQGADHDTYTPRPSQLASLGNSATYLAYGPLEFEITWRERLTDAAPSMQWQDMSNGITLIGDSTHGIDPHYWLSPKQAKRMADNIAHATKNVYPTLSGYVDSALVSLESDIAHIDSLMSSVATTHPGLTFVIYHPALGYLARDYGMRQLSVAQEGVSPQPRRYAELADSAREAGARVFFIQAGTTPDRVRATAEEIGAKVVSITPEGDDWMATMTAIAEALRSNE